MPETVGNTRLRAFFIVCGDPLLVWGFSRGAEAPFFSKIFTWFDLFVPLLYCFFGVCQAFVLLFTILTRRRALRVRYLSVIIVCTGSSLFGLPGAPRNDIWCLDWVASKLTADRVRWSSLILRLLRNSKKLKSTLLQKSCILLLHSFIYCRYFLHYFSITIDYLFILWYNYTCKEVRKWQ